MPSCCLPGRLMRLPSITLLGLLYMAYVLAGGAVFWKLESRQVQQKIAWLEEERAKLLSSLPCLDQQAMDSLTKVVRKAIASGLSLKDNHTIDGFWKFTSSAVFAATVVTTIGYGNMSPTSTESQIFCVFFALFGIPLNVVVLNRVGKYMLAMERKFCNFIEKKTVHKRSIRVVIHLLSMVIGTIVFFLIPMILFAMNEGWSYAQAIYYCFISLSTIGFGDYVADSNPDRMYPEWYGCLVAVWIFFGMAWVALLVNHGISILESINVHFKQERDKALDSWSDSTEQADNVSEEASCKQSKMPDDPASERVSKATSPDNLDKSLPS